MKTEETLAHSWQQLRRSCRDLKKSAKLHVWLINGKSGDYVVNALKLGNNIETALENTKMEILWRYVELFNKFQPSKITAVGSLMTHYGDDVVLNALITAKQAQTQRVEDVVAKLRNELFKDWAMQYHPAKDVFKLLNLRNDGYTALRNSKLEMLSDYVTFLNRINFRKQSFVKSWRRRGEGELAVLLTTAIRSDSLHRLEYDRATELQTKLFQLWRDKEFNSMDALTKKLGEVHVAPSIKNLVAKQFKEFSQK
ncbi:Secreted RxLR effector peptide protein [Phytophthora palmivora]|uniref:Secreted RxLR effector peptide protein n=1 Tax=Phytophthora palmivora TaxID=4796 RepID=A0A2P4XG49_9STRA|nr:Secreted RxLR effector peptide protein [Phytophthora palmivora]